VIRRAAALRTGRSKTRAATRAFLKRVDAVPLAQPLQAIDIRRAAAPAQGQPRGGADRRRGRPAAAGAGGHDLGLISEAGLPAVADPGAALVAAAHAAGVAVLPLPARARCCWRWRPAG
jgi:16S rRNA (cytidine1402-2'-O)-methyltransferase